MKKYLPIAAVAGALACFVAAGSAQATPASGAVLGKLTTVGQSGSAVEKAHYYHHRRHWWCHRCYWRHHHRRHHWY